MVVVPARHFIYSARWCFSPAAFVPAETTPEYRARNPNDEILIVFTQTRAEQQHESDEDLMGNDDVRSDSQCVVRRFSM